MTWLTPAFERLYDHSIPLSIPISDLIGSHNCAVESGELGLYLHG